jgi:DNA-binding response OmpR family regulator
MMRPMPARHTVLIVDDRPDIREAYRFLLELDEFRVLDAWSATTALAILDRVPVDAILTDLYMPGDLDGIGLIDLIRRRPPPHPALIAMSGAPHLAYESSLITARTIGADAALVKPIGRDTLVTTIRRLIGGGPALMAHR